jgi:ribosomal protein S13
MNALASRLSLSLCSLCLAATIAMPAHAQDGLDGFDLPGTASVCFGMLGITEQRALQICDALALKENVKARELAQRWIAEQPQSAAAQFALAEVLVNVEGNLARALFHLNRAEELTNYSSMGRAMAAGNAEWHFLTLSQLSYVNQLMGNQEASLLYLDKMEDVYGQEMESFRGWPLIKMQRWDEARASADSVLANSNDPRERSRAWNTLCAVELADLRPAESLEACDKSMNEDDALASDDDGRVDTVYLMNAAEVALSMLRVQDAENYLTRATRYLNPNSVGDPWISLLYLYMNQSRFDQARNALDSLLVWRDQQEPIVGVMNRAEHFLVSATFLMLAGYPEDAATLSATALNQPDRTGSFSADEAQKDSIAALINHIANRTTYEKKLEARLSRVTQRPHRRARLLVQVLALWSPCGLPVRGPADTDEPAAPLCAARRAYSRMGRTRSSGVARGRRDLHDIGADTRARRISTQRGLLLRLSSGS